MVTTQPHPEPARRPVARAERALAPDLARGAMLLLIALANAAGVVFAGQPGVDPAPEGSDSAVSLLMFTLVHAHGYPVFAVMFGYGLVQLARRQSAAGARPAAVRAVIVRRNAWLLVFGFAHAALLNYGDFLGAYGLIGIVMTLVLLNRGNRVHAVALWLWALAAVEMVVLGVLVAIRTSSGAGSAPLPVKPIESLAATDYLQATIARIGEWPLHTLTVLPFALIAWLGMWAARRQVLEQPDRYRRLLRWTAAGGLGISIAGGLPMGLLAAGWLQVDESTASLISLLHGGTGMFAGPGYAALIGLLARRAATRDRGPVIGALAALGRRSLSGYLFQSIAWLVLLAPYTLALGGRMLTPTWTALLIAVAVWLGTVVLAAAWERSDRAGPAEWLLRRLTYGRRQKAL